MPLRGVLFTEGVSVRIREGHTACIAPLRGPDAVHRVELGRRRGRGGSHPHGNRRLRHEEARVLHEHSRVQPKVERARHTVEHERQDEGLPQPTENRPEQVLRTHTPRRGAVPRTSVLREAGRVVPDRVPCGEGTSRRPRHDARVGLVPVFQGNPRKILHRRVPRRP